VGVGGVGVGVDVVVAAGATTTVVEVTPARSPPFATKSVLNCAEPIAVVRVPTPTCAWAAEMVAIWKATDTSRRVDDRMVTSLLAH
jgi:hypothetical protein